MPPPTRSYETICQILHDKNQSKHLIRSYTIKLLYCKFLNDKISILSADYYRVRSDHMLTKNV